MLSLPSRLMFVADASHASDGLPRLVERAVAAGVRFVELRREPPRTRAPETGFRVEEARSCVAVAGDAVVLVNDRLDVALASGAHGAHVGQDDLEPRAARRLLGEQRMLGLSTHDEGQLAAAQDLPLDYVALGPIFGSPTKSGHAPPVGLAALERGAAKSRLPIVAIGGITTESIAAVLAAGAAAVAVASAIGAGDVEASTRRLLAVIGESA